MNDPRPLHRLFDMVWDDFSEGIALDVDAELDLSLKQQFLDLVLLRRGLEPVARRPPDGFEELAARNLVTFKSHREALDAWTLYELIGHYVNYRKQSSPSLLELLPESDYKLFAVCARYPQLLAGRAELRPVQTGVYEVQILILPIRIIVINQLPLAEHNAMLHLFSSREELVDYGRHHYRPYSTDTSTLLLTLFKQYYEDPAMSEKLKEWARQAVVEALKGLPPEERVKGLLPEERLKGLPPEERVKGLPAEERLKGLSTDELLQALSPEMQAELLKKFRANALPPE